MALGARRFNEVLALSCTRPEDESVALMVLRGKTYTEIATEVGINRGGIHHRLNRALGRLVGVSALLRWEHAARPSLASVLGHGECLSTWELFYNGHAIREIAEITGLHRRRVSDLIGLSAAELRSTGFSRYVSAVYLERRAHARGGAGMRNRKIGDIPVELAS